MVEIRLARTFNRVDVDRFLNEITAQQFGEQIAYDLATRTLEEEAHGQNG